MKKSRVKAPEQLEIVGRKMHAVKAIDVRAAPEPSGAVLEKLKKGDVIHVSGRIVGKPWLMLERSGEVVGYVPEASLANSSADAPFTMVSAEPPAPAAPSGTEVVEVEARTTCREMTFEISSGGGSAPEAGTVRGCQLRSGDWLCRGLLVMPSPSSPPQGMTARLCAIAACAGDQAEGHPALAWVVSWYTASMSVEKDACRHADRMALTEQALTKQLYHQLEQSPIPERQTQRRVCRDLKDALSEQLFPFVQRIRPASSSPPGNCPAAARTLSPAVKQFLDEKGT